jgi:hypothetical protein
MQDGGKVRRFDELELVSRIRSGKLTGVELVRRDDEETWQPLFESRIFRREVPAGDPRDAARWRLLRNLGGHFTGFIIVSIVMFATQGHLPWWLAIWGVVLALQVAKSLPAVWSVFGPRRLPSGPRPVERAVVVEPPPPPPLPDVRGDAVPAAISQEAARVRTLIEQRGGKDTSALVAEVDRIVKLTGELARWQSDLEEQTSDEERSALGKAVAGAETSLEHASQEQDRRLFERQLDVLRKREEAISKALRVLARLRARRELAEHQLKQLRLDLSRGAAVGLDVPELSSRLQYIRHEVDAREEVEEIDAATD